MKRSTLQKHSSAIPMRRRFVTRHPAWAGLVLAVALAGHAGAATWKAGVSGDWFEPTNWESDTPPGSGDDVVITNAGSAVLLTNTPPYGFASLTLSRTLTFSNWNTSLTADNIVILTNGTMTLPLPFTNNAVSNRIHLICTNLFIAAGGKIDAEGRGFRTGLASGAAGHGPGAGGGYSSGGGGAGHGGFGGGGVQYIQVSGSYYGGITYGSAEEPGAPGSGGGWGNQDGGDGGGAIHIDAAGTVTINGTINADGKKAPWVTGGGGSGGSVWITCRLLAGTNGLISANGGWSGSGGSLNANGGGGRIAVHYHTTAQALEPVPQIRFSTLPGMRTSGRAADVGTLWFPDTRFLAGNDQPSMSGWVNVSGFSQWALDHLTLSNQWLRLSSSGFTLTVTNDLAIIGPTGRLDLGGESFIASRPAGGNRNSNYAGYSNTTNLLALTGGGRLILTNGATLAVYGAETNGAALAYGALVQIAGEMSIGPACTVYAYSHPTNGGSVHWRPGRLTLSATNSFFIADYAGFAGGSGGGRIRGFGPGGGGERCGGSYGGRGGNYNSGAAATYGDSNAPALPGSGGGWGNSYDGPGGSGGGLIWVTAAGRMTVNGTLSANGASIPSWFYYPGAGSGGGIFLTCTRFEGGAKGKFLANGGNDDTQSTGGAGGGGRIALVCQTATTSTTFTVQANAGTNNPYAADNGTVFWRTTGAPGTMIIIQ